MDTNMDVDMDIDLGPLPEPEPIEMEQTLQATTEAAPDGTIADLQAAETQPEKVHVRGVDELTTDNIKEYAYSKFPVEHPARIEWIDDTSANIVYSAPEMALQALAAFTHVGEIQDAVGNGNSETATPAADANANANAEIPALRLRSAKVFASHADSVLQVRLAVKADKKKPRAYEASRFYMMHPEHDPRERLRRELEVDRRRGGGDSDGDYRRRRFDGRELRRRRERDQEDGITANMYDDTGAGTDPSDGDRDLDRGRGRPRGRRGSVRRDREMELFPDEGARSGRLRDRSASPGRDTLMMEGGYVDEDRHESRRRFRERSRPPRRNEGRELFGSADGDANTRELFPNKTATTYLKKELFPSKVSNHRRSDAINGADETADLFARRLSIPLVDGAHDANPAQSRTRNRNIELFPDSSSSDQAANIRGAAAGGQDQGFAIRGAAENGISIKGRGGASVRELFPSKYNNQGKELFSEKIEGRGGPRRRAEDMFT